MMSASSKRTSCLWILYCKLSTDLIKERQLEIRKERLQIKVWEKLKNGVRKKTTKVINKKL